MTFARSSPFLGILLFLVMVVLPFVGSFMVLGELEERANQAREAADTKGLDEILISTARQSRADSRCEDLARHLTQAWRWGGRISHWLARFPEGSLHVYFFAPNGKRLDLKGVQTEHRSASERFMRLLKKFRDDLDRPPGSGEGSFLTSFCGGFEKVLYMAKRPGRVLDFMEAGLASLGGWFPLPSQRKVPGKGKPLEGGDLVFWLDLGRFPKDFFLRETVARQQKLVGKGITLGWVDMEHPEDLNGEGVGSCSETLKRWLGEVHRPGEYQFEGFHVRFLDLPGNLRVFGIRPLSDGASAFPLTKRGIMLVGALCTMIFLFHLWKGGVVRLSVRWQLMGVFLLAGTVSCAALHGFGISYVASRRDSLVNRGHARALQILSKVDDRFFPSLIPREGEYKRCMKNALSVPDGDFLKTFRAGLKHDDFFLALLIDAERKILDLVFREKSSGHIIPKKYHLSVFPPLGSNLLNFTLRGSSKVVMKNPLVDGYLAAPYVLEIFQRALGSITTFNFLNRTGLFFLDFLRTPAGVPRAVFFLVLDNLILEENFLKKVRRRMRGSSEFRLGAAPKTISSPMGNIPPRAWDVELFRSLLEKVRTLESPHSELGNIRGKPMLATIFPGNRIANFHLFLLTPFDRYQMELEQLGARFRFLSALTMIFMLALGMLFSQSFLGPLKELSIGLENLKRMRFKEKITIRSGDELEEIAVGLDSVFADLAEIQAASAVQKQLLSEKTLSSNGYRIRGFHRGSEPVAGSFFMAVPLPSGRIGLLAGETAAQGILRGLLVSMFMTTFRLVFERNTYSPPGEILSKGLRFLEGDLSQKPLPALILGVLETGTGVARFLAGGEWLLLSCLPGGKDELVDIRLPSLNEGNPLEERSLEIPAGARLVIGSPGVHARFFRKRGANQDSGNGRLAAGGGGHEMPACGALSPGGTDTLFRITRAADLERLGGELFSAIEFEDGTSGVAEEQVLLCIAGPEKAERGSRNTLLRNPQGRGNPIPPGEKAG